MKNGIDRGFCFSYSLLSYRRKFLRTLWAVPVLSALLILALEVFVAAEGGLPERAMRWLCYGLCILLQLLYAAQLIYNEARWRQEETARKLA